jgi:copper chaperone CopZ
MIGSEGKTRETIEIINMTCRGCARTLENELRKFEGIDYAVNLDEKSITVSYSPRAYTREDFEKAIELHGYKIQGKTY